MNEHGTLTHDGDKVEPKLTQDELLMYAEKLRYTTDPKIRVNVCENGTSLDAINAAIRDHFDALMMDAGKRPDGCRGCGPMVDVRDGTAATFGSVEDGFAVPVRDFVGKNGTNGQYIPGRSVTMCQNCRWFKEEHASAGECRLNGPVSPYGWPTVDCEDFCGEWAGK